MPEVIVRKGEPVDRALKRLKNKLDAEGILEEVRRLRAFETPSPEDPSQGESQRQTGPRQVPFQSVVSSCRKDVDAHAAKFGAVELLPGWSFVTVLFDFDGQFLTAASTRRFPQRNVYSRTRKRSGTRDRCRSSSAHWSRGSSPAGC